MSLFPFTLRRAFRKPRDIVSLLLMLLALMFLLVEFRIWPIEIADRLIHISLAAALFYLGLRIRRRVNFRFFLPLAVGSLIFPPLLLLAPLSVLRKDGFGESSGEGKDLLSISFRSVLVICKSIGLASSIAISIASRLATRRRVVLVDWSGSATDRLRDFEVKVVDPKELWFGHAGRLGSSYYMTAAILLSYISGVNASLVGELLKSGDVSLLQDARFSEPGGSLLLRIIGEGSFLLHQGLPSVAGVLIVDVSKLPVVDRNAVSLLVLLQSIAYDNRDFVVVAPLLSPLTDERISPKIRDELRWIISSLSEGGGIITSVEEASRYFGEFDLSLKCDECDEPIYKLDSYLLCPLREDKVRRKV